MARSHLTVTYGRGPSVSRESKVALMIGAAVLTGRGRLAVSWFWKARLVRLLAPDSLRPEWMSGLTRLLTTMSKDEVLDLQHQVPQDVEPDRRENRQAPNWLIAAYRHGVGYTVLRAAEFNWKGSKSRRARYQYLSRSGFELRAHGNHVVCQIFLVYRVR